MSRNAVDPMLNDEGLYIQFSDSSNDGIIQLGPNFFFQWRMLNGRIVDFLSMMLVRY